MAKCPFYQLEMQQRGADAKPIPVAWCSHTHSPVPAAVVPTSGEVRKLRCAGNPAKCEIPVQFRPPLWLV